MPVLCLMLSFVSKTSKSQRSALMRRWLQMRSLRTYLHHNPLRLMSPGMRDRDCRFHFVLMGKKSQAWTLTLSTVRLSTLDPRARLAGLIGEVL